MEIPFDYIKAIEDCIMCICLECFQENGTDPETCEYSNCYKCDEILGVYTEKCSKFVTKKE